jgi:hypothetical protein
MTTRRFTRFATTGLAAGALALSAMSGCYQPQGPGYSGLAPETYISTEMRPKTVSLFDGRTGETIWSIDIPVNKQLVMRFYENKNEGAYMPDEMKWRIMEMGKRSGGLHNSIPAPPRDSRRVDVSLRPAPEIADASSD